MMGTVLQGEALDRLRPLLARGRLGSDALAALAHDLAVLRPPAPGPELEAILRLETLLVRRTLLLTAGDADAAAGLGVDLQISWRHLFSPRIQTAEILEELVPTYLDALEACPLAQLPLGYANGRVWSGGGDGDDDGGRPLDEDAAWDADGDRVWDLTAEAAREASGDER